MYAVVEIVENTVCGVTLRKTKHSAEKVAVKLYKEQLVDSSYSDEAISAKLEIAEMDLTKHGSIYFSNWMVSVVSTK